MGADRVIAINVGDLSDREAISYTLLGVAGSTLDAMMRSTTRDVAGLGRCRHQRAAGRATGRWPGAVPTNWSRRATRPPRRCATQLLPLAVSEADYAAWRDGAPAAPAVRRSRRRSFVRLEGFGTNDAKRLEALLARHVGARARHRGDRERSRRADGTRSLRDHHLAHHARRGRPPWPAGARPRQGVRAAVHDARRQPREHDLERLPASRPRPATSPSTWAVPARNCASTARSAPIPASAPSGIGRSAARRSSSRRTPACRQSTVNVVEDDAVVARYGLVTSRAGANLGVNLGALSDVRLGAYVGRTTARDRGR